MPVYDFQCEKREHVFERKQGVSEPFPFCEKCEGETRRLISQTSFTLKGGGWYKDGYNGQSNNSGSESSGSKE